METESLVGMNTGIPGMQAAESHQLVELVTATGDQELISTLKSVAARITTEAESAAGAFSERACLVHSEAAQALAAVTKMVRKAQEDARFSALATEQVTDEALRHHLEQIARAGEARLHEGLERIERAQLWLQAADKEARALEAEAKAALQQAQSRPEVIAWRKLTTPFLERIGRAWSRRVVNDAIREAERQGLADEILSEAAISRMRQLGELAWRTRETVSLWARYAPGGDGMYPAITRPGTSQLAAAGPGTIFEVSPDIRKVAVHLSEDGCAWVRRKASGPFKARGALVRRIDGQRPSTLADAH
jgi:hypothetical protein